MIEKFPPNLKYKITTMYNDQDLEFDDCHSTNTWNIFIQTDVQCTRMYTKI